MKVGVPAELYVVIGLVNGMAKLKGFCTVQLPLSLLEWSKKKIHQKFPISFHKILRNEQSYANILPRRFHLNDMVAQWGFVNRLKNLERQSISP